MFGFLGSLLGIVPAITSTINGITQAISNEHIALINAKTDQEKNEIMGRIAGLQAQQAVLVAESQRSNLNIWIRSAYGVCALFPVAKILVWDKVVGSLMGCVGDAGKAESCAIFNTDKLSDNDWKLVTVVVGFYFVSTVFRK